jgi:hypothetical protein
MGPHHKPGILVAAALVLAAGCGTQSGAAGGSPSRSPGSSAPRPASGSALSDPVIVRLPLSDAKREALLAWVEDWRTCMARHEIGLPQPQVFPRHIAVDVSAVDGLLEPGSAPPPSPSAFMQTSMRCITALGGPPATFLRTGGIVDLFRGTCAVSQRPRRAGQ